MTACVDCGDDSRTGYFYPDGQPLCRACYEARTGGHVAPRVGRDRDPVRNEAAAHEAARARMNVIENRVDPSRRRL